MKIPEGATRKKTCKRCEFIYEGDDIFSAFHVAEKRRGIPIRLRNTCVLCAQDQRTEYAKKQVWKRKAANALKSHAKKLGIQKDILASVYGWNIDRIAHRMEYAYDNGCEECGCPYKKMEGGRKALTIDIWDRRLDPNVENTKLMCDTCNKAKGIMTPEQWGTRKRLWRIRGAFLETKEGKIAYTQPKLFDCEVIR